MNTLEELLPDYKKNGKVIYKDGEAVIVMKDDAYDSLLQRIVIAMDKHRDSVKKELEESILKEVKNLVDALSYYADYGALGVWNDTGKRNEEGYAVYSAEGDRTSTYGIAASALREWEYFLNHL